MILIRNGSEILNKTNYEILFHITIMVINMYIWYRFETTLYESMTLYI